MEDNRKKEGFMKSPISIEDMMELEDSKEAAKELWEKDVKEREEALEKYRKNFQLWFDEVYAPNKLIKKHE